MEIDIIDKILKNVRPGYQILEYKKFTIKKPLTVISILERFFINLWNKRNNTEYCKFSHTAVIALYDGELYVYECIGKGLIRNRMYDWLKERKLTDLQIQIPDFKYDEETVNVLCRILHKRKIKYDFKSTLFHKLIEQVTNERVWVGARIYKRAIRVLNCSEFNGYVTYIMSEGKLHTNWFKDDPQDFFISKNFLKLNLV